jgi:hypothetical protein
MSGTVDRFALSGRLPGVHIIVDEIDRRVARRLRVDLRRRGFVATIGEPGVLHTAERARLAPEVATVFVVPFDPAAPDVGSRSIRFLDQLSRADHPPIILADLADKRVESLLQLPADILRYGEGGLDYDGVFADLLVALLGPLPSWLDLRAAPTLIAAPTGIAWWADDLLVADEHFGQVSRISANDTRAMLVGLHEPHHIDLDRHKLLVADKGAHRLLLGTVDAGSVGDIRTVLAKGDFLHPNGVHQGVGMTAVADTDHHRVLMTTDDLWAPDRRKRPDWKELAPVGGLRYPCGVFIDGRWIWVADTFHQRLVVFDHNGREVANFSGYGWGAGRFAYPTSIVRWKDLLLVADAEARRIQAFSVDDGEDHPSLGPLTGEGLGNGELGAPWIGHPFGLSVNHNGRLAVADRLRRCAWLLDLPALGADWGAYTHDPAN